MLRFEMALLVALLLAKSAAGIVTSDTAGSHGVTLGMPAFGLNLDGVGIVGVAPRYWPFNCWR